MSEFQQLADLVEQAYDGKPPRAVAWHGPSVSAVLSDVSREDALTRLSPASRSIWEVVLHVAFWDEVCVRRLKGERLDVTTGSPEDWPELAADTWPAPLARAREARGALLDVIRSLSETDLDTIVPDWGWTFYTMIHGTLHHDLYHAGQIAFIRAALERSKGKPPTAQEASRVVSRSSM